MKTPLVFENNLIVKVGAAEAIADPTAPTATELGTLTDLSGDLAANGWNPGATQNMATLQKLDGVIISQVGGRGSQPILTFVEDGNEGLARGFFDEQGKPCVVVVSRQGQPEVGDPVDVYSCTASLPVDATSGADTFQTFTVNLGTNQAPAIGVAVVAGD
jgi:hypothetical protein